MAWCKLREFLVWRGTCITQVAAGNMEIWGVGWSNVQLIVFRFLYWYKIDMLFQIIYAKGKESQGLFFCQISFSFYRWCFCHRVSRCVKVRISGLSSSMGRSWHGTPEALSSIPGWDLTFHTLGEISTTCRLSWSVVVCRTVCICCYLTNYTIQNIVLATSVNCETWSW